MPENRVGILGSGDAGRSLARGFADRGWDVTVGTRSPEKLDDWLDGLGETGGSVTVGSFADAARAGDVAVLAVLGAAAPDVLDAAGHENFADALLVDASNPLDFSGETVGLLYGGTDSLGERVQAALPDARVVKCFNTVNHEQMVDPEFSAETPPMLVCGDDPGAKQHVESILRDFGWPGALDVGGIESARYLEALVPLWVRVGQRLDTWMHAFAVVE